MDKLLAKLCETRDLPSQHESGEGDHPSSCSSMPITPATDAFGGTDPTTRPASAAPNESLSTSEEVLRLRLELARAKSHISNLNQELAHTRRGQDSGGVTPILSSDSDYAGGAPLVEPIGTKPLGNPALPGLSKLQLPRDNVWQGPVSDDCRSDISDAVSATGFNRSRGIWNNGNKSGHQNSFMPPPPPLPMQDAPHITSWPNPRNQGFMDQNIPPFPDSSIDGFRGERYGHQSDLMRSGSGRRGNRYDNRFGNPNSFGSNYGDYNVGNMGPGQYDSAGGYPSGGASSIPSGGGMGMFPQYGQQPVSTSLSPHATEFTSTVGSSWKSDVSSSPFIRSMVDVFKAN